jgi:hypothetical protein
MKKCGNCQYFYRGEDNNLGFCVRNPPQVIDKSIQSIIFDEYKEALYGARSYYPVVSKNDPACGEWKRKSIFEYKVLP